MAMTTFRVVEHLDLIENFALSLFPIEIDSAGNTFPLEWQEETLCHRVVVAVSASAHTGGPSHWLSGRLGRAVHGRSVDIRCLTLKFVPLQLRNPIALEPFVKTVLWHTDPSGDVDYGIPVSVTCFTASIPNSFG